MAGKTRAGAAVESQDELMIAADADPQGRSNFSAASCNTDTVPNAPGLVNMKGWRVAGIDQTLAARVNQVEALK